MWQGIVGKCAARDADFDIGVGLCDERGHRKVRCRRVEIELNRERCWIFTIDLRIDACDSKFLDAASGKRSEIDFLARAKRTKQRIANPHLERRVESPREVQN